MEALLEIVITVIFELTGEFFFDSEIPLFLRVVCGVVFWSAILGFAVLLIVKGILQQETALIVAGALIILVAGVVVLCILKKRKKL